MCAIAGIIQCKTPVDESPDVYSDMLSTMTNRGPDDFGTYFSENCVLLHKRLAVIDPELSHQPMTKKHHDKTYVIVYNGELYNTAEIKAELVSQGFTFSTNGDTEVVLSAYIRYGEKCVDMFNGIFAFAIYQVESATLFFARDPMGVKPFFYYCDSSSFIFASSIPTLLAHKRIKPKIDSVSVCELMLLGPGRTPSNAIFSQIKELPRGFFGTYDCQGLHLCRYFSFKDSTHTDTFEQTVEKIRYLVTDAITRQLISSVPLGTFLSGGLDSSIISAVAAEKMREKGKTLDTFSVTYKDNAKYFKSSHFQPNSDDSYIETMVNHIQSNHHSVTLDTPEIISSLYEVVDEKGLPGMADVDSSLLAFCKRIKNHVTVALSGECADELFGGYPWYRDENIRMREGFPWSQNASYRFEFLSPHFSEIISPDYVNEKYNLALSEVDILPDLSPTEKRMREMFILNTDHFMQTLLMRKDSCSMHASLEVRVPFCDKRIAQYLYSTPWSFKDYEGREKGLLRHAFEHLLPSEIVWRKKSPYPKTHNPYYLSALREIFSSILADGDNPLWDIVNIKKAETLMTCENFLPWYGQLMTTPQTIAYFIQTEYWLRKFSVTF